MKLHKVKRFREGYALLAAIIAINLFAIFVLKAHAVWETELQRDLEEELIFRGRQYVTAIDLYMKKNANIPFKKLDDLVEKKFLRQRYKDPITNSDKWNLVMRAGASGKGKILIVPEEMFDQYITQAVLIGVASTSCEEGFKVYRKKKKYCEWAFYLGDQENKDMPELEFVDGSSNPNSKDKKEDDSTVDERDKEEPGDREEPSDDRREPDDSGRGDPDNSNSETRDIEPGR